LPAATAEKQLFKHGNDAFNQSSASFTITTVDDDLLDGTQTVTIGLRDPSAAPGS
jgi:hypothetical protein